LIFRWSTSSFWTNVELVDHSSASRPLNSQLGSWMVEVDTVAWRSRPIAPTYSAFAPSAFWIVPGTTRSGSSASSRESVTLLQAISEVAPAAAINVATAASRPRKSMRLIRSSLR